MNSLRGHLLIAKPDLLDPNFARTVLLMIDHDDDGAMGIVLNRPTDATMSVLAGKVFEDDFEWDKPIHLGGPVPGPLMVLHTIEDMADREILPGVFHTVDATKVQEILTRKAEPTLPIANYSGWGPGQLESEFAADSWVTLPATADHVFRSREDDLWKEVVGKVNARQLSEFLGLKTLPPDPSLN